MSKYIKIFLFRLAFGLLFFSVTVINGQEQNLDNLLQTPRQDIDICNSTIYILQNNLPKRTSKKISKKLSKELRKVNKRLKIKKRYYNTGCGFVDCVVEDIGKTKATHALYDFNSDKIKPSAQFDLLYLLGLMEDNPEISLELSSHTDTRGVDAYNLDLSQRRANSVVKWLTDNGINPDRLKAVGYGETRPAEITSQQEFLYPFVNEGAILTIDYINAIDSPQIQDIAHALNRRTEVAITNTVIRKILGGSLDLMLLDLDNGVLVNEVSSDFIGSQKDLYNRVQNMSWELVANFGLDKCKRGLGALLVPIIIVGGGAGFYAYTEMMAEDESIGAPPGLPEDCCGK